MEGKREHPRQKRQKEQGPPELVTYCVGHAIPNLVTSNKHRLILPHTSGSQACRQASAILFYVVFNIFFKSLTISGSNCS